jgi:hypothetical protein
MLSLLLRQVRVVPSQAAVQRHRAFFSCGSVPLQRNSSIGRTTTHQHSQGLSDARTHTGAVE